MAILIRSFMVLQLDIQQVLNNVLRWIASIFISEMS